MWNDRLYFGTRQGYLYCRNALTGATVWKTKLSGPTRCAAVISTPNSRSAEAIVYIGCDDGNVWAVDAVSGDKLWKFKTGSLIWMDPWVYEGVLYVASNDGYLYALQ